jgi:ribonuclease HI
VWGDQWILGNSARKVQTSVSAGNPNMKVSELIDPQNELVEGEYDPRLFISADAEAICNIALRPVRNPDKLIWQGTATGCFSVRSAYHQEMAARSTDHGESSMAMSATEVWKQIWKFPAPGVVRNFVWKLCSNILSTKDQLFRRHIVQDPVCPMCSNAEDTLWHMVWTCPASVAVWQECSQRVQKLSLQEDDGLGWFLQIRERLEGEELVEAVTIARLLWLRRNACVFGREVSAPNQVVQSAQAMMASYKVAIAGESRLSKTSDGIVKRWMAPEQGLFKLNWDAALGSSPTRMGVGAVLRDGQGRARVAMATIFPNVSDPTLAEAMALWKAVNLCLDLGYKRVIFEGDALHVVQSMNQEQPWGQYAQLLDDVRTALQGFLFHGVQYASREANKVAHALAKLVVSHSVDHVWIDECPSSIYQLVLANQGSST